MLYVPGQTHSSLHSPKVEEGHLQGNQNAINVSYEINNCVTDDAASTQSQDVINSLFSRENKTILLSTAIVYVQDVYDTFYPFECILNMGSQSFYATINCVNILKLKHIILIHSVTKKYMHSERNELQSQNFTYIQCMRG